MSSPLTSESTLDNARTVTTYLLREPVKEAVRDALREEGLAVTTEERAPTQGGSGPSKMLLALVALAVGGLAYYGRKRMSRSGRSSGPESIETRAESGPDRPSTGASDEGSSSVSSGPT